MKLNENLIEAVRFVIINEGQQNCITETIELHYFDKMTMA